ncbi:MAG: alpha-amylase family glycosyl hydrolase [Sandaracinaceae bacterium]
MKMRSVWAAGVGALAVVGLGCSGVDPAPPDEPAPRMPSDWFRHANFVEWHFTTVSGETFNDIRADLDAIEDRGVGALLIYAPYYGNPDGYYGAEPLDVYATNPTSGTMEEFRALVDEAHARDIAVMMWMVFHSASPRSAVWQDAVQAVREGRDTPEARSFLWVDTMADTYDLGVLEGGWAHSEEAGKYYATVWGYPAWNFNHAEAQDACEAISRFWLDTGIDGFMYDAPPSEVGHSDADRRRLLGDLVVEAGASYRFAEGVEWYDGQRYVDDFNVNFTHFGEDDDTHSIIDDIVAGTYEAADLEELLTLIRDYNVARDGGAMRLWVYNENIDAHLFTGAVLAGLGVTVDMFHSAQPGDENTWVGFDPARQARMSQLMRAIRTHPAEEPGGGRRRLSTGADPQHYAALRTSVDGTQLGLNVYNFKTEPSTITVDLTDSGLALTQTPTDIVTGADAPAITGAQYTVELPAYGFLLLDVDAAR